MPLHTANGSITPLREWNNLQAGLAMHLDPQLCENKDTNDATTMNQLIDFWCTCFAQAARLICDRYEVATDEFEKHMKEFIARICEDIQLIKWLKSEQQKKDIGIEGLRQMIVVICDQQKIQTGRSVIRQRIAIVLEPHVDRYYIDLSMSFPNIDNPDAEPHVESVRFPISAQQGDDALARMCAE